MNRGGSQKPVRKVVVTRVLQLLGLPLVVLMLLSCGTQPSSRAQAIIADAAPLKIIPIPTDHQAKLSLFSKLVLNPPQWAKLGAVQFGWTCRYQRDLKWERGPQVLDEEDIRNAFNFVFQKASYRVLGNVDDLFEDVSTAELIIAGLVKDLKADICNKVSFDLGRMVTNPVADFDLRVNWQVFSPSEDKVVYEVSTDGQYHGPGNFRAGLIAAFANATEKLLTDRGFFELAVVQKKGKDGRQGYPL